MILTLTPQVGLPGQPETVLAVAGDVLTVDGTPYDLSNVPDGGAADFPAPPFVGPVHRIDGTVHATVLVSLGADAADDQPASPWTVDAADGPVAIPAARRAAEPDEQA